MWQDRARTRARTLHLLPARRGARAHAADGLADAFSSRFRRDAFVTPAGACPLWFFQRRNRVPVRRAGSVPASPRVRPTSATTGGAFEPLLRVATTMTAARSASATRSKSAAVLESPTGCCGGGRRVQLPALTSRAESRRQLCRTVVRAGCGRSPWFLAMGSFRAPRPGAAGTAVHLERFGLGHRRRRAPPSGSGSRSRGTARPRSPARPSAPPPRLCPCRGSPRPGCSEPEREPPTARVLRLNPRPVVAGEEWAARERFGQRQPRPSRFPARPPEEFFCLLRCVLGREYVDPRSFREVEPVAAEGGRQSPRTVDPALGEESEACSTSTLSAFSHVAGGASPQSTSASLSRGTGPSVLGDEVGEEKPALLAREVPLVDYRASRLRQRSDPRGKPSAEPPLVSRLILPRPCARFSSVGHMNSALSHPFLGDCGPPSPSPS